jgi:hypothetical protein
MFVRLPKSEESADNGVLEKSRRPKFARHPNVFGRDVKDV